MSDPSYKGKKMFVYHYAYIGHFDGKRVDSARAFSEEVPDNGHRKLAFICPYEWLPKNSKEFLQACIYYKVTDVQPNVVWFDSILF